jgi:hypothetical protein
MKGYINKIEKMKYKLFSTVRIRIVFCIVTPFRLLFGSSEIYQHANCN